MPSNDSDNIASHSPPPPTSLAAARARYADADLDAIGAHCALPLCRRLDFLPFLCPSCRQSFCTEHRTEDAHSCTHAGEWARARARREREEREKGENKGTTGSGSGTGMGTRLGMTAMAGVARSGPGSGSGSSPSPCAEARCNTRVDLAVGMGVHCRGCRQNYCLRHRMPEHHACAALVKRQQQQQQQPSQAEWARAAFARLRGAWGSASSSLSPSNGNNNNGGGNKSKKVTPATRVAALAALKRQARGDTRIPPERRVYLTVEAAADAMVVPGLTASSGGLSPVPSPLPPPSPTAPSSTSTPAKPSHPTGAFFFDANWPIGRVLDEAARRLSVPNINNRAGAGVGVGAGATAAEAAEAAEAQRLRVYHVEGGRVLEFGERVGKTVAPGDTVVLLRGIGAPPELIEL